MSAGSRLGERLAALGRRWNRLPPMPRGLLVAMAVAAAGATLAGSIEGLLPEYIRQGWHVRSVHLVWLVAVLAGLSEALRRV
jgi:hypothetical protein